MLSIPDMAILGVLALLVFGEKKLPGVMRQAGKIMRDVQNTSQSFLREMDRAADVESTESKPADETALHETTAPEETMVPEETKPSIETSLNEPHA